MKHFRFVGEVGMTDRLIASWRDPRQPASFHLLAEAAHGLRVRSGDAAPLGDGEVVPGCGCASCADTPMESISTALQPFGRLPDSLMMTAKGVGIHAVVRALALPPAEYRGGDEWATLCPLHADSKASLCLNEAKRAWYCHPCGRGGDNLDLVQAALNLSFRSAVHWLIALKARAA